MSARPIDNSYHVAGQISTDSIPAIRDAGYKVIVCMRPDNEGFGQPPFSAIKAEAEACGIAAHYLPVSPGSQPLKQASELKKILKGTEGPVLAYCASGNRATIVYQLSKQVAA